MMNIDFQTDRMIIVVYPRLTGGKFLTNCLGLSRDAVLQDKWLALRQLGNKLDPGDKYNLIMDRLGKVGPSWNDLNLGCTQYFNSNLEEDHDLLIFPPMVQSVTDRGWYAFKLGHFYSEFDRYRLIWPNAQIIKLVNYQNFIMTYRKNEKSNRAQKYWNDVKNDDWPDRPPDSLDEYNQLSEKTRQELEILFEDEFRQTYLTDFADVDSTATWNCDWYLSAEDTVESVRNFYKLFNLRDFNPDWITNYWRLWTETMLRLDNIQ